MSVWQQGRASTWAKGAWSQMTPCDACLAAVASGCEGAPWGAAVPHRLCGAAPPSQAYTPTGSQEHPGGPTKAGGSRSGVRDCCGCSRGQAVAGSAGVGLLLFSPAQARVQNRGAETVDLRGKGRRSGQCRREYF